MNRRICRLVVLMSALCCLVLVLASSPAQAGIVKWEFDYKGAQVTAPDTSGYNTFSDPLVPGGASIHNWSVQLTEIHLQFGGFLWIAPGADTGETGIYEGTLPFTLYDDYQEFVEKGEFVIGARLAAYVDEDGKGHFDITDVKYGTYNGTAVTGIGADGYIEVESTPVPEPSAALLFLGGLAPVGWMAYRRRRR